MLRRQLMKGLGNHIKTLRKERRITLVEVAHKTRIDQATLSRIENGKMTGTLRSHMKIAEALGLRLPQLYEDLVNKVEEAQDKIARKRIGNFSHSGGAVAELLTSGVLQKKMMPLLLRLAPGGITEPEQYPSYTERFIYVLSGKAEVILGPDSKTLKTGDSLYFTAGRSHYFKNSGETETRCLSIMTPVSL